MRRAARWLVGVLTTVPLAVTGAAALGPPAAAATAVDVHVVTLHLVAANWFSRAQVTNVGGLGVQPPAAAPDPTVPDGDLPVAGPTSPAPDANNPGQPVTAPQKESYLGFDLSHIPNGVRVTKVALTVPLDPKATQGTVPGQSPVVVACAAAGSWSDGDGNESFAGRPGTVCGSHPPVRRLARGGTTYVFDITGIAAGWFGPTGLNTGVALTDDPANTNTAYQVVFGSRNAVTATVTYVVPAPAPSSNGGGNDGGTTGTGTSGGGTGGSAVVPPIVPPPAIGSGDTPQQPAPQPSPVVEPSPAPTAALTPTAAASTPGMGFWLVAALLLTMLVVIGVVLHTPVTPAESGQRRGVGRALLRNTVPSPGSTP